MVVKEGLGLYKVISEGIINVSDKFFDMEYLDAVKGLEIYKQAVSDFGNLQVCRPLSKCIVRGAFLIATPLQDCSISGNLQYPDCGYAGILEAHRAN